MSVRTIIGHVTLAHEIRDYKSGTTRYPLHTMYQNISALVQSLLNPLAVLIEQVHDLLVVDVMDFMLNVFDVFKSAYHFLILEGCLDLRSAHAYGSNFVLLDGLQVVGSIFIPDVQSLHDHFYFW